MSAEAVPICKMLITSQITMVMKKSENNATSKESEIAGYYPTYPAQQPGLHSNHVFGIPIELNI